MNVAQFLLAGETFVPLPDLALWWPAQSALLVADAHVGKAATFRARGIPVPEATTDDTLTRLTQLVRTLRARQIIFLGDFLHAREAHAPDTQARLAAWRAHHAHLACTLVRGNHDDHAGDPPAALAFTVVNEPLCVGRIALLHHPRRVEGHYALCGHLHPAYRLRTRSESVRLPCFWLREGLGVLPAFGAFTGAKEIPCSARDGVWLCAPQAVIAAPGQARADFGNAQDELQFTPDLAR
jgi:uncharacterized protein